MMSIKKRNATEAKQRAYDHMMLRKAFSSLMWNVFVWKRDRNPSYTKQMLATELGVNKSAPSRWFSSSPNWTLNTIADLAWALDVEIEISAREKNSGTVFMPSGLVESEQKKNSVIAATSGISSIQLIRTGQDTSSATGINEFQVPIQKVAI